MKMRLYMALVVLIASTLYILEVQDSPPHAGDIYQAHVVDPFETDPIYRTKYIVLGASNGWVKCQCMANGFACDMQVKDFWKFIREQHAVGVGH